MRPDHAHDDSTTNDIIGGNSGSPLVNARGEIVGLIFDGNIFSLGGDYGYDPVRNRSVAVDSRALARSVLEGLPRRRARRRDSAPPAVADRG
jgi:S1-C subfamily serine protease